ncbi:5'-AMP-activated protein kinase subunit beta-1 [Arctopsyche grandis]|uniref:5'-AMP-activated protein kinase subunit beta-1 n=1 Tax=Arctopsyche grandis TaxID=121162 RepID=UPI00406D7115
MGNANSGAREGRRPDSPTEPRSPSPQPHGEAFVFPSTPSIVNVAAATGGAPPEAAASTKAVTAGSADSSPVSGRRERTAGRPRSNTVSEGSGGEARRMLPTVFKWEGGGKQVYISGTFTEWKTLPMVKSHGDFVTIIDLPEGEHQYKFYVDGEWKHDPDLKLIDNGMGSKNNLVSVKNSDFEVFQALAKDNESVHGIDSKEYSQEVPQTKPWDKVTGPPILPPHLLQVILNKDTPLSCEPTLLPEPNHVMLNHLYALSIKDGVMVLSATHRYRKKYVTTLLYKPI